MEEAVKNCDNSLNEQWEKEDNTEIFRLYSETLDLIKKVNKRSFDDDSRCRNELSGIIKLCKKELINLINDYEANYGQLFKNKVNIRAFAGS